MVLKSTTYYSSVLSTHSGLGGLRISIHRALPHVGIDRPFGALAVSSSNVNASSPIGATHFQPGGNAPGYGISRLTSPERAVQIR